MVKELSKRFVEPVVNVNEVSRIAEGVTIKGDISSTTDLRIDGHMEGKLYSEGRIVVGENAVISGSVLCTDIDFFGKMDGDLFVRNVLSIKGTAAINGAIHVRKLQVEMGAQINGSCQMISEAEYDKLVNDVVEVRLPKVNKSVDNTKRNPASVEVNAKNSDSQLLM